jgi:hypothetical protein
MCCVGYVLLAGFDAVEVTHAVHGFDGVAPRIARQAIPQHPRFGIGIGVRPHAWPIDAKFMGEIFLVVPYLLTVMSGAAAWSLKFTAFPAARLPYKVSRLPSRSVEKPPEESAPLFDGEAYAGFKLFANYCRDGIGDRGAAGTRAPTRASEI